MKRRKPTVRRACANCGKWYQRCNKLHIWDQRNPGHRTGWHVQDNSYCLDCSSSKTAEKILVIAGTAKVAPTLRLVSGGKHHHQERKRA